MEIYNLALILVAALIPILLGLRFWSRSAARKEQERFLKSEREWIAAEEARKAAAQVLQEQQRLAFEQRAKQMEDEARAKFAEEARKRVQEEERQRSVRSLLIPHMPPRPSRRPYPPPPKKITGGNV